MCIDACCCECVSLYASQIVCTFAIVCVSVFSISCTHVNTGWREIMPKSRAAPDGCVRSKELENASRKRNRNAKGILCTIYTVSCSVCVYTHINTTHKRTHTYTYRHTHAYTHTHINTYTHTRTRAHTHKHGTYICKHTPYKLTIISIYIYIYEFIDIYTYTYIFK